MLFKIETWENISANYTDAILLGNGASIAVSPSFAYTSLLEHACSNGMLPDEVGKLFDFFKTNDFELVLRLVWQASNVNRALQIPDVSTRNAYLRVRDSLIQAVRNIHPECNDVSGQLPNIYRFLQRFNTIISLNYDLIVYWAMTYGFCINDQHSFKDCFVNGYFDENWQRFRDPINYQDNRSISLVFYPHGSLILCRNTVEQELKITAQKSGLLGSILSHWQDEKVIPLFVSEGSANQKVSAIQNSYYLSKIYREVFPAPKDNLTIYGWGFGEQDIHILRKMAHSGIRRVAISVFGNDQAYCNRSYQIVRESLGPYIHVDFFDCQSKGCWNQDA